MKSKKWYESIELPGILSDGAWYATLGMAALIVWSTQDHVFFWDTVQFAGKHSTWFYENGFGAILLPNEIDSGHPPFFGWYLALVQTLVGRTLLVTHWAMLPWLWLVLYQIVQISRRIGRSEHWWLVSLLLLADPVLLGQLVLVSPDSWLVGGFLLSVNGILSHRRDQILWGVLLLGLTSTRGMMIGLVLFPLDLWWSYLNKYKITIRNFFSVYLVDYLPGGLAALAFLVYHLLEKRWIGHHAASPWAPTFVPVDLDGFWRKCVIVAWRMIDFGRLFIWLALLWLATRKRRLLQRYLRSTLLWWLLGASVLLWMVCSWPGLYYTNLTQHRYWLPFFLCFSLLFAHFVVLVFPHRTRARWWLGIVAAGLLTGNLWVYPPHIAQGWDSTLAQLPYYKLRQHMLAEADRRQIPLDSIATAFPEIGPLDWRDLSGRQTGMVDKDTTHTRYLYYSTVMNDFTDAELAALRDWRVLWWDQRGGVRVLLLERE